MFGHKKEDLDYMSEKFAAERTGASRFAYMLSFMVLAFLIAFVIWSRHAILDEVTRGEAQVIPSSRVQNIQNLEGGIISEMLVKTGDIVSQGDVLVRIDNSAAESAYREEKSRYNNLRARIIRLEATVAGNTPNFPAELEKVAPSAIEFERNQYRVAKEQLDAEIDVLRSREDQRRQEVGELRSRLEQLQSQLDIIQREYSMTQPLVRQGVMPQLDLIRLQGQINDLEGEIRTVKLSIPRAQTAVSETRQQIKELRLRTRSEASKELNDLRAKFESLAEVMRAGEDRFRRTEVRSPVDGTVKEILVNTIGGVIQPGQKIMEIVPLNDTLLVEAEIKPADIAFISPNQKAIIKITAYDFSIYGGLEGVVEQIGADTITDEEGNSFYKVYLRTQQTALEHKGNSLPIIPGMTASVDILTGQKTVFDYLMKPILKAKNEALRER